VSDFIINKIGKKAKKGLFRQSLNVSAIGCDIWFSGKPINFWLENIYHSFDFPFKHNFIDSLHSSRPVDRPGEINSISEQHQNKV